MEWHTCLLEYHLFTQELAYLIVQTCAAFEKDRQKENIGIDTAAFYFEMRNIRAKNRKSKEIGKCTEVLDLAWLQC